MSHHRNACLLLAGSYLLLWICPATAQIAALPPQTPRLSELPPALTSAAHLAQQPRAPLPSPDGTAQTRPAPSDAAEELDEVTVMGVRSGYRRRSSRGATRTDTPLLETPQSVQVIPRRVLEDQQATRLDEGVRNVSGVQRGNTFGGTVDRFIIRGFESFELLRNGFRDGQSGLKEIANIEQIEVIKGPASITYGRLEPGGIINYVTKQPLSVPYFATDLKIGSHGLFRPSIDLSGPLEASGAAYRLNAVYESANGFRDFTNVERFFVAPVVSLQLDPDTRLTFEADWLKDSRPLDRGLVALGRGVVDVPYSRRFGEPGDLSVVQEFGLGARLERRLSNEWRLRGGVRFNFQDSRDYRAEPVTLDERTGLLSRNFRGNDDLRESYAAQSDFIGTFRTGAVSHTLLVGLDYFRGFNEGQQRRAAGGSTPPLNVFFPVYGAPPQPLTLTVRDGYSGIASFGVYLQDQVALTPWLQVLAGVRYDQVDQQALNRLNATYTTQRDEAVTPRVAVLIKPTPTVSLYGSYSRSFTPQQGLSQAGTSFRPETATGFEVGAKAELLGGGLFATLAAYEITKQNVLTADPANTGFSVQVGEQRSRGIELDLVGRLAENWNIVASYALNRAVVERDNTFIPGNYLPGAAGNSASFWTNYEFREGTLAGLALGIGLFYVDNRAGDLENSFVLPAYVRTDLNLAYRGQGWRAGLGVRNLLDVRYIEGTAGFRTSVLPGAGVTFVGSLSAEF